MTSVCNLWSSVQQYAPSNQLVVTQWRVLITERGTMQPRVSGSQLSGLAGDQQIHYYACAEGVTDGLMWVWWQVECNATIVLQTYFGQNWLTSILFWTLLAMIIRTISVWQWSASGQRGPDNRCCTVLDSICHHWPMVNCIFGCAVIAVLT